MGVRTKFVGLSPGGVFLQVSQLIMPPLTTVLTKKIKLGAWLGNGKTHNVFVCFSGFCSMIDYKLMVSYKGGIL